MDERDFVLMKVRRFHELRKLVLVIPKQFYLLGTTFVYCGPASEEEHLPEIKAIIKDVEAMIGKIITVRRLATG
jgi:hypothetical protein